MSVIDGGTFKCSETEDKTVHFETADPAVWEEHLQGHNTESGSGPCAVCGVQTSFIHKPVGKKPLCDKCREDLLNQ